MHKKEEWSQCDFNASVLRSAKRDVSFFSISILDRNPQTPYQQGKPEGEPEMPAAVQNSGKTAYLHDSADFVLMRRDLETTSANRAPIAPR